MLPGPLFHFELLRAARWKFVFRERVWVGSLVLLGFVLLVVGAAYTQRPLKNHGWTTTVSLPLIQKGAAVGVGLLLGIFASAITFAAPASGLKALHRDRTTKMLDFVMLTDLRDRELFFDRPLAELVKLWCLPFTVLPVFLLLMQWSGLPWWPVLAAVAALACASVSLTALGVAAAVRCRTPGTAQGLSVLPSLAYIGAGIILFVTVRGQPTLGARTLVPGGPTLADAVGVFNIGNPVALVIEHGPRLMAGLVGTAELLEIAAKFATFHLLLTAIIAVWVIWRGRDVLRVQLGGPVGKPHKAAVAPKRPPVSDWPVAWRVCHVEIPGRSGRIAKTIDFLLFYGGPIALIAMTVFHLKQPHLVSDYNATWRAVQVLLAFLLFIGVYGLTFESLNQERLKRTLEPVLLTPLGVDGFLAEKLRGYLVNFRHLPTWIAFCSLIVVIGGGMHWSALPGVVASWATLVLVAVMFGLHSGVAKWLPPPKPKWWTAVIVMVVLFAGSLLIRRLPPPPGWLWHLMGVSLAALLPPSLPGLWSFWPGEFASRGFSATAAAGQQLGAAAVALGLHLWFARYLWHVTLRKGREGVKHLAESNDLPSAKPGQ